MSHVACRYAIVRFMPHVETGEFANVGIVLACPTTGFFDFRLEDRRYRRVTHFFEHIGARDYTQALKLFREELIRIRQLAREPLDANRAGFLRGLFDRLVHPREAIIQFSEARAVMADDPAETLKKLFSRYVEHDFGERSNAEQTLVRRVQDYIQQLNLALPFKSNVLLGNGDLQAHFPFVQQREEGQALKVIKPFFLAQKEASDIRDHAGTWIYKLTKMRRHQLLPDDVMFPVQGPEESDTARYAAYQDVISDLQQIEIRVVGADSLQEIRTFALQ